MAQQETSKIMVGVKEVFEVTAIHSLSASERARLVNNRIQTILRDSALSPRAISVKPMRDGNPAVVLGDFTITEVTRPDAARAGMNRFELAGLWSETLKSELGHLKPLYLRTAKFDVKMLTEHNVLLFIIQITVLLLTATIFGELSARLKQPPVIGQLFAGVFLGHSVLGSVFPNFIDSIFPVDDTQSFLLEVVSWIGVIFLLMLTGMETDLKLVRKEFRSAMGSIALGTLVPFFAGCGLAYYLPAYLFADSDSKVLAGLFLGTVFSVSSVPVVAKILMEMELLRGKVGQLILTTSLCQDVIGCLMLAVVAALADTTGAGASRIWLAPLGTLAFVLVLLGSRPLLFSLIRRVNDNSRLENPLMTLVVVLLFASSAITHFLGVHVVLGAFAIGVLLAQSPMVTERVVHPLRSMTMSVFAPIFFAAAGLHVNLGIFLEYKLLIATAVIALFACLSKVFGSYIGCRIGGLGHFESLAVSSAANARGAMGLIVGILGFSLGIISIDMLSIIIIVSIVTTAMAPPMVRWSMNRVGVDEPEESSSSQGVELFSRSFVTGISRILVPTGGAGSQGLMLKICAAVSKRHPIDLTLLHVSSSARALDFDPFSNAKESVAGFQTSVSVRRLESEDVAKAILDEASKSYDLVVMGANRNVRERGQIFGEIVDSVSRMLDCAFLVVNNDNMKYWPPRKILVPATGRSRCSQAAELGVVIADALSSEVVSICVVEKRPYDFYYTVESYSESLNVAKDIVQNIAAMASALNVSIATRVTMAEHAGPEIIRVAKEEEVDLIVMSGSGQPTAALFYGQTTQYVFANSPCPVAVLVV